MQKKLMLVTTIIVLILGTLGLVYLFNPTQADILEAKPKCGGTVDKKPGESFKVEITFKNKGTNEDTWEVVVTFEGESWMWIGEEKLLTLKPNEKKALTWEGNVPEDAVVDSVARLIVYYNDEAVALNWWIHVMSGAELCIVDSKVS